MDVTEASPERLRLGVAQLLEGNTLSCRGVNFYMPSPSHLTVDSFSDWQPDRTTEAHAREKIERSKLVLKELAEASAEFKSAVFGIEPEFACCHDYGQGSVVLAKEYRGNFEWQRWLARGPINQVSE